MIRTVSEFSANNPQYIVGAGNRINFGENLLEKFANGDSVEFLQNAAQTEVQEPVKKDRKKLKTVLISTAALAGAIVAGVFFHKASAAKKTAKELAERLNREIQFSTTSIESKIKDKKFDFMKNEVDEILKQTKDLPAEQKAQALKNLENVMNQEILNFKGMISGNCLLPKGMEAMPEDVLRAVNDGQWFKGFELFNQHCEKLPKIFKAQNAGKTVEETIVNVFGKESKIKPHTYDLSKEEKVMHGMSNCGGFDWRTLTNEGIATNKASVYSTTSAQILDKCSKLGSVKATLNTSKIGKNDFISHGVVDGRYVTKIQVTGGFDDIGRAIPSELWMISRNAKPTPAQKDVLSFIEHPEKFNSEMFQTILKRTNTYKRDNNGKVIGTMERGIVDQWKNFDYDLILSTIQSLAK